MITAWNVREFVGIGELDISDELEEIEQRINDVTYNYVYGELEEKPFRIKYTMECSTADEILKSELLEKTLVFYGYEVNIDTYNEWEGSAFKDLTISWLRDI